MKSNGSWNEEEGENGIHSLSRERNRERERVKKKNEKREEKGRRKESGESPLMETSYRQYWSQQSFFRFFDKKEEKVSLRFFFLKRFV